MLASIAHCLSLDILDIEARHASARRLVTLRSVQTWQLSMKQLNADWVCRQVVILRERWTQVQTPLKQKKGKQNRGRACFAVKPDGTVVKEKRARTGGGSTWRAFMHKYAKGQKPFGPSMQGLRRRYHMMKAAQALASLAALGLTMAHRQGAQSFLNAARAPASRLTAADVVLAGGSTTEETAAELQDLRRASRTQSMEQKRMEIRKLNLQQAAQRP